MENKPRYKQFYKSFITALTVILALSAFVLFPRGPYCFTDGGSKMYCGFLFVYTVTFLNQLPDSYDENGVGYYQKGVEISVLGRQVYTDRHPDYSRPSIMRHSPDIEKVREEIERALAGEKTASGTDK